MPPLTGILVADFSRVLAGPLATQTLADLGARVIKVEHPATGDETRHWAPPASERGSTYFDSVNRGKESIALDLKDPGDLELARELIARADVVIENFLPGAMARLGLDPEQLLAEHAGLIWCSITGFGSASGTTRAGYDFIVQAASGLMSITGQQDGPPTKAGVALVDVITAKDATIGILAALHERSRTQSGSRIDVSLMSSALAAMVNRTQAAIATGDAGGRMGSAHPSIAPYQTLRCSDGELAVAIGNDGQFARLIEVLDVEPDERFRTNSSRVANRLALIARLERVLESWTAADAETALLEVGLAVSRVRTVAEGLELASEVGLGPVVEVAGVPQIASPIHWTPPRPPAQLPPPLHGEHDSELRAWLATPKDLA